MNFLLTLVVAFPAAITHPQSDPPTSLGLPNPAERARELRLKLPFEQGAEFECCQGIGGHTSHHHGSQNGFSWDFEMPVGTPVHASAHGRVVLVVDGHREGGFEEALKSKANAIWIDHGGGAVTTYVHLAHDSSLVQVGQLVAAGQPIAKSGNTGFSKGPHLHFAVVNCLGTSLQASFVDVGVPVEGGKYRSQNDGVGCTWWTGDSRIPSELFSSVGIRLSAAPRAHVWDPGASLRFAGQCPWRDKVAFFATDWAGGKTLFHKQVSVDKDGSFEFKLKPSELAYLRGHARFRVAVAPVDRDSQFANTEMLGIHWMEPAPDEPRAVYLPFFGDEPRTVFSDEMVPLRIGKSKRELHSVSVQLGDGQKVRACAGGRVLQSARTSKAGIRSGVHPRSACIRIDHGGGLELLYAGLDPKSVTCVAGDVVSGGDALGTVGVESSTSSRKLMLLVDGADDRPLEFIEQGGRTNRSGDYVSENSPENALAFKGDSRLASTAFASNGVTLEPENPAPASTYHVGTRYVVQGSTAEPSSTVEFVVRTARARKHEVLARTIAAENGAFEFEVVLPDSLKRKPYRYALTSYGGDARGNNDPEEWRLLLAMR